MTIRHMRPDDHEPVAQLLNVATTLTFTVAGAGSAGAASADSLGADMARAHSESFVALAADGSMAGHAYARVRRAVLWLDRLAIRADAAADETAATLLHAVISNYLGEPAIAVEVREDDLHATQFFEREGFTVTGERDAGAGASILTMRKPMPRA